jgi:hypothetical protein
MLVALTQTKRYWLMYGLYTFGLVLALATPGQVAFEAESSAFQILAGVAILVVGLAALHALEAPGPSGAPQSGAGATGCSRHVLTAVARW